MKKIYSFLFIALLTICFSKSAKAVCAANFTSSNVANVFSFTDASTTSSGSIITWLWNFGDLSVPGTTQNPIHTYNVCGVYTVSLTIFTTFACTNTYTSTITVNSGMTGSYASTVDTTTGTVNFQGSPLGLNVDYSWNFGDGNTGTGAFANNTYATSGTYYVCLTVSDTAGICTNTFCDSVVVHITPASCSSTYTYMDNGSGNLSFQAAPFSLTNTYNWDYGDGSTGTGLFSLHNYATAGTYYVCVTTTDSATMCTSTYCDSVIAAGSGTCLVTYTYVDVNGLVAFNASPLSLTNTYSWDFGDGNTGTSAVTTNTYTTSGTYYACVTMVDAFNSCTNSYCDSVTTSITAIGIIENGADNFNLVVYPNPINDQVTIAYQLIRSSFTNIDMYDIIGNKISSLALSQTAGKHQTIINTEHLSKGAYLIKLSNENSSISKLIIKN